MSINVRNVQYLGIEEGKFVLKRQGTLIDYFGLKQNILLEQAQLEMSQDMLMDFKGHIYAD